MRKVILSLSLLFAGNLWAAGGASPLTVSSGTYLPISTYSNDDGGSRQAIILGNRTSSATATVDDVTGLRVSLSTSALTTTNGVKVEAGATALPIVSTNTLNVKVADIGAVAYPIISTNTLTTSAIVNAGTTGIPIVSTNTLNVSAAQSGTWNVGTVTTLTGGTVVVNAGTSAIPIVSTNTLNVSAAQSGVWSIANSTTAVNVLGTVPVSGTVAATQSGVWAIANSTTAVNVLGTVPVSGTVTVLPGAQNVVVTSTATLPVSATQSGTWNIGTLTTLTNPVTVAPGATNLVITATATIPVSGSFSATLNNPSTATINAAVPGYTQMVGGQGTGGNAAHFRVDASSYLYVNVAAGGAAGGTSSTFGAAFPGPGTAAGFVNPGTGLMQAPRVDSSSNTLVGIAYSSATFAVANSTIAVRQDGSIWSVANSTIGVIQAAGNWTVANSTIGVAQAIGNWTIANSTIGANDLGIVSTNTLPTPAASAANVTQLKDPFGRQIVVGGVHRSMISVATLTVTGTTPVVLVSSGGTNNYNHLCGCVVTNTSATNTYVTLYPSGAITSANSLALGAPANDIPSGIWPGCVNPFYMSAVNSSISVVAANSVTSLLLTCQYYTSL